MLYLSYAKNFVADIQDTKHIADLAYIKNATKSLHFNKKDCFPCL